MKTFTPRVCRLAVGVALACAALASTAAVSSADPTSDYNRGLRLGAEAYQYGVPLLDSERIFASSANVTGCDPVRGHGPVNRFCSIRNLASADQRTVNAPNKDTPYSFAWLDLSKQPRGAARSANQASILGVRAGRPVDERLLQHHLGPPKDRCRQFQRHSWRGLGRRWPPIQGPAAPRHDPSELALQPSLGRRPHLSPRPRDLGNLHRIQNQYCDHAAVESSAPRYKPRRHGGSSPGRSERRFRASSQAKIRSPSITPLARRC